MEKRVIFNEDICKGCALCVNVCPQDIIKISETINLKGYHPAYVEDQEACTSCTACGRICPDGVITVYRPIERKNAS
ncbi:4Fe-4S binding protein [Anaerobacillus sp. CMMVII]|uniref:4Fe-4S dicluster domain-containing protein n=1 Tax=Anaerobacillus sp. CMMVII TaxID=2755588 RepID=UPI0021B7AA14|nr:4Fe-4S binding protein [Anaerobacillus sp. CMMVII]MCT8138854.1 4Fe-4S binding protein [Anaerobacillus sp. CMMVII]